jgi:hypothetical protein
MTEIGHALSNEEHHPNDLIRYAQRVEEVGFSFALFTSIRSVQTRKASSASISAKFFPGFAKF